MLLGSYLNYSGADANNFLDPPTSNIKAWSAGGNVVYTLTRGFSVGAEVFYSSFTERSDFAFDPKLTKQRLDRRPTRETIVLRLGWSTDGRSTSWKHQGGIGKNEPGPNTRPLGKPRPMAKMGLQTRHLPQSLCASRGGRGRPQSQPMRRRFIG